MYSVSSQRYGYMAMPTDSLLPVDHAIKSDDKAKLTSTLTNVMRKSFMPAGNEAYEWRGRRSGASTVGGGDGKSTQLETRCPLHVET